jgi:hypothetical protein
MTDEQIKDPIQDLIQLRYRDGLFHLDDERNSVYVHAHCYALEGLLALQEPAFRPLLEESADRLARMQSPKGGMPKHRPSEDRPELASDATAQAIRIWQCLDPARYETGISRGFDFLESMADPEGGIRYSSRSSHLNSWTTIFTIQALLWEKEKGEAAWLI